MLHHYDIYSNNAILIRVISIHKTGLIGNVGHIQFNKNKMIECKHK